MEENSLDWKCMWVRIDNEIGKTSFMPFKSLSRIGFDRDDIICSLGFNSRPPDYFKVYRKDGSEKLVFDFTAKNMFELLVKMDLEDFVFDEPSIA